MLTATVASLCLPPASIMISLACVDAKLPVGPDRSTNNWPWTVTVCLAVTQAAIVRISPFPRSNSMLPPTWWSTPTVELDMATDAARARARNNYQAVWVIEIAPGFEAVITWADVVPMGCRLLPIWV